MWSRIPFYQHGENGGVTDVDFVEEAGFEQAGLNVCVVPWHELEIARNCLLFGGHLCISWYYFPTCQLWGLLDFMSAGLLLLLFVLLLLLRQTSTASSWSQWSLPGPNSKPNRAFPAGHPQQARDASGPCRTRTASPRSECSLPDLNYKRETAGSLPDPNSRPRMRGVLAGPQLHSRDRSGPCRTRTASPGSEWSAPDSL